MSKHDLGNPEARYIDLEPTWAPGTSCVFVSLPLAPRPMFRSLTNMASTKKPLDIAVVGGSLAALMTSIPLTRLGHNVTILERSPLPLLHNQGAGVVAGGETQAFYRKHDLSMTPIAVHSKQRLYLDQKGGVMDREESEQRMTSWDLLYYLGRANFDQVDTEYLEGGRAPGKKEGSGEGKYKFGRMVTGVEDVGSKVRMSYDDTREGSGEKSGTIEADFLIVADGPSSRLRRMLIPQAAERKYAGYVAFRGTVPEDQISKEAENVFVEKFTFYHGPGTQILGYAIPGKNGTLEKGRRLVNWVWYCNYEEGSEEYQELMTDVDGKEHRFTVPTGGKMRQEVLEMARQKAKEQLPPQFFELVFKTSNPFVQAITDLPPPENVHVGRLLNGKAVLVGDALAGQ